MKRKIAILLCILILVLIPQKGWVDSNSYYASPQGGGDGKSASSPFQIADFWDVAQPGDTLYLLDGTYTGSRSMINPPQGLSGIEGHPITIKALNDGQVEIDGEGKHIPILLEYNNWFIIEGMNAHDSRGSVVVIIHSDHNIIRRVCAWDAADGNHNIFGVHYSRYNLIEDSAGWGTARKIFSNSYGGDYLTLRRTWGRWEASHVIGPKMTYTSAYNSYNALYENVIGTWDTSTGRMQEEYVLLDYDGQPWKGIGAGVYTKYAVNQPYGILAIDGNEGDKRVNSRILGSIAYTTPQQQVDIFAGGIFTTKLTHQEIRDSVAFIAQEGIKPLALHSIRWWRSHYEHPTTGSNAAVLPRYDNGYYYNAVVGGYTGDVEPIWPEEEGARVTDGEVVWECGGPNILEASNLTGIGGTDSVINSRWAQKNILLGSSVEELYEEGENIFNTSRGANIYYRYQDGVLTDEPLWPWPMDQRIYDAMIQSGDEPFYVTEVIESIFGPIPLTYSISGRVTGDSEQAQPVSWALITVEPVGYSTFTDNEGNYSVDELSPGNYIVRPAKEEYRFTPAQDYVQITTENVIDVNFTAELNHPPRFDQDVKEFIEAQTFQPGERIRFTVVAEDLDMTDGEEFVLADLDRDGDVDLEDYGQFYSSYSATGRPTWNIYADLDRDGDCDLRDFRIFAQNFTGSGTPQETLTYRVEDLPNGAIFGYKRHFSWTPTAAQAGGSYEVTFGVEDSVGAEDSMVITITVGTEE